MSGGEDADSIASQVAAQRWDDGCRADEPRNAFVIPTLEHILHDHGVEQVIDIGAATGYIARTVRWGSVTRWILVERDGGMLAWLTQHLRDDAFEIWPVEFPDDTLQEAAGAHTLVLVSYTTLEFTFAQVDALAGIVPPDGLLLLFVPDVLEDIVNDGLPSVRAFVGGEVELVKPDKFRGGMTSFRAHRIESIIESLLSSGLTLSVFETYVTEDVHRHYALLFRRPKSGD